MLACDGIWDSKSSEEAVLHFRTQLETMKSGNQRVEEQEKVWKDVKAVYDEKNAKVEADADNKELLAAREEAATELLKAKELLDTEIGKQGDPAGIIGQGIENLFDNCILGDLNVPEPHKSTDNMTCIVVQLLSNPGLAN